MGKKLLELYRDRFNEHFKNHPNGKEIVSMLVRGECPKELVDLWFAEAEMYNWEKLSGPHRGPSGHSRGDGKIVRFPVHRTEDNNA